MFLLPEDADKTQFSINSGVRLFFNASGSIVVLYDKQEYIIETNCLFFAFENVKYKIITNPDNIPKILYIDIGGKDLFNCLHDLNISLKNAKFPIRQYQVFTKYMEKILSYSSIKPTSNIFKRIGCLYDLLGLLWDEYDNRNWYIANYCDDRIKYYGTWYLHPSSLELSGSEHYTRKPSSYVEFKFLGTGIRWYGVKSYDCGKADVLIDGIYVGCVDSYNPTRISQQLLY